LYLRPQMRPTIVGKVCNGVGSGLS
jgi:hypothetical protein